MPNKILVLFAHPLFEKSRVNRILLRNYEKFSGATLNDLYQNYPEFNIDVEREQQLLLANDVIIFHHPFYWYSCPPMIKQWIDMVLEAGWAYGTEGNALKGKTMIQFLTTGGGKNAYTQDGHNRYSVRDFLRPFEQTAMLCKMNYLPPFVIHGTHRLSRVEIHSYSESMKRLLSYLSDGDLTDEGLSSAEYINDLVEERRSA